MTKLKVHPKRQPVEAAAKSKSWRNAMLIHPAAELFPLMSAESSRRSARTSASAGSMPP